MSTTYHTTPLASGVNVHYASAGDAAAPVVLLLHGFPSSAHQFRTLIPRLADAYRVLAPDLPGFGHTTVPPGFAYTFANFATVIGEWLETLNVARFALYVFDYGAPTGFRLALARPERVAGIVSQNGNAYAEGLGDFWDPLKAWWATSSGKYDPPTRATLHAMSSDIGWTRAQYLDGVPRALRDRVDPAAWTLDFLQTLKDEDARNVQLDILWDYRSNVALYPAFQEYFRQSQVPLLAVWGRGDGIFIPPGAEAFARDIKDARIEFVDSGHFALETHVDEIAGLMREFLKELEF